MDTCRWFRYLDFDKDYDSCKYRYLTKNKHRHAKITHTGCNADSGCFCSVGICKRQDT